MTTKLTVKLSRAELKELDDQETNSEPLCCSRTAIENSRTTRE